MMRGASIRLISGWNLLADWAPDEGDRHRILVESPDALFFVD
jgi:hypothetical protein